MNYYYIHSDKSNLLPFTVCTRNYDDYQDRRIGNEFTDKDEAIEYCTKLNKILLSRGFSFKDKNGDIVHIGDIVVLDKDTKNVVVRLIAENGSSFMFYDDNNNETFVTELDKVTLVKEQVHEG